MKIAESRKNPEKEFLIEIFNNLDQLDQRLESVNSAIEVHKMIKVYQLLDRKIRLTYVEVFADKKDKSRDRYARSVEWNRFLDGNYSYSDHVRATRRIETEEMERLEGFEISLKRIENSLLYAESLLI